MKVILLRYGELFLKGNNRKYFEDMLIRNIKNIFIAEHDALKIKSLCKLEKIDGRLILSGYFENEQEQIIKLLTKVAGLYSLSVCDVLESNETEIFNHLKTLVKSLFGTFKVETNRADKNFSIKSLEFNKLAGEVILKEANDLKVDVIKPEHIIKIDIRQNGKTYISCESKLNTTVYKCLGGLPVGCSGSGLVLLSGGIDSPVSAYYMAKRGMSLSYLHFESYPYTSKQALDKVKKLAEIIKPITMSGRLIAVSLKEVQEEINKNCDNNYMIVLMRRIMMRVASKICKLNKLQAIITGENLGQVASQTVENLTSSNNVSSHIILRPLIGMDKQDIMKVAKEIETFETSILPYEDCCTVFLPKSPIIRGNIKLIEAEEQKLDVERLVENCLKSMQLIKI